MEGDKECEAEGLWGTKIPGRMQNTHPLGQECRLGHPVWLLGPRCALLQAVSAVFTFQNREGLAQGPLGGHQNQVSGREFRAEDGQELRMEAWEKDRATKKGRNEAHSQLHFLRRLQAGTAPFPMGEAPGD